MLTLSSGTANSEDPTLILKNQCVNTLYEFLDASTEVWPQCPVLAKYLKLFKEGKELNSDSLTQYLHKEIVNQSSLFERLDAKDMTVFQESFPLFTELNVYSKLSEASSEVQDTCWAYIKQIVQSASLCKVYNSAPPEMLEKVNKVAESFMKKMEDGTFDVKELDPMALTQMMMDGVDKKEMEKWASEVMNPQAISSLMGVMQNVMGNAGEEGPAMDFSSLASTMAATLGSGGAASGGGASPMAGMNPELLQQMMGGFLKNLKK